MIEKDFFSTRQFMWWMLGCTVIILIANAVTSAQNSSSTLEYRVKQETTSSTQSYKTTLDFSVKFNTNQIDEIRDAMYDTDQQLWKQCRDPFVDMTTLVILPSGRIKYLSRYNNGNFSNYDYIIVAEVVRSVLGSVEVDRVGPILRDSLSRPRLAPQPVC
ncbi:MAG: hypothetical protein R3B41_00025 [Candidatus Doudnabacteria bacterium]